MRWRYKFMIALVVLAMSATIAFNIENKLLGVMILFMGLFSVVIVTFDISEISTLDVGEELL